MEPITREEMYLAAAAGEYSGELPEPKTRLEYYLKKIKEAVENGSSVAPEDIDAAIEAYLNSHDADIVTEQELSDALAGYYDKDAVDTTLNEKQDTLTAGDNISIETVNGELTISATDTTYSAATTSAPGLMSAADKAKLDGISATAEVNVQSDWNQGDDAADDYIRNKPANLVQDASYVHTDNNFTNAEKAKADGAIQSTEKGTANGVAELNANGKVPTSQLPAYVDDVLSYNSLSDFPATGEDGKIYIAKDTNLSYRWGSSEYVVISPSLALGSTSSTAYRGDWGAEDRAAIGTLSTLNTTEKSNLVGAINELKTDSDAKQGTLTFDSAPTSGSTNPVTSGGVYTALAGKQAALTAGENITIANNNGNLTISATDTTYSAATTSAPGLMSAADKAKLDGIETGAQRSLTIDQVYPVGSIYMSVNSTSPSTLFGGTWERLKDTFLLAAGDTYAAGSTGGEAAHTMTEAELAPHRHPSVFNVSGSGDFFTIVGASQTSDADIYAYGGYAGGGQPHNNMPPYLAVYMWKRTA